MRTILHSDLNSFYASVEIRDNPELARHSVAVCGSVEERAGIVLAKNELAKSYGVKTDEAIWQAKQKCPGLVVVSPHYDKYLKVSREAREIYEQYTDVIEPFGIDEAWLDVTGSRRLFGDGLTIAERIREEIREKLKVTVSVGVSFNKVFAKLGSDMKKPDATTVIARQDFRDTVWQLPASDLLGVGPATRKKLSRYAINTIGRLAETDPEFLRRQLGVVGVYLWRAANGMDTSPVTHKDYRREIKSVGNSTTTIRDLCNDGEVWRVMLELAGEVSRRMRVEKLQACGVQISIKDCEFGYKELQAPLELPSRCALSLARAGMKLFREFYHWEREIRSIGIRAIRLAHDDECGQTTIFMDPTRQEQMEALEATVDKLGERYGKGIVRPASLFIPTYSTKHIIGRIL